MRRAKWGVVVVAWLFMIGFSFVLMIDADGGDFGKYYRAARNYLPERMPYVTVVGTQLDTLSYPPFLPQLLMPLAKSVDLSTAARVWFAFNTLAQIALLATLTRYLRPDHRFYLWLLAAFFVPFYEAQRLGQVNIILTALIGFAWAASKSNRRMLAGFLLAAAAWIKIYPALILIYFLWKRDWAAVRGGIIGGVGLGLFQIAVSGPDILIGFFRSLLVLASQGEASLMWKNSSIYGFTMKLFQENSQVVPLFVNSTLFTVTRIGLTALALGALFILTASASAQSKSLRDETRFDLEYALAVLTMLLISPWLYPDSLAVTVIVFFILWRHQPTFSTGFLLVVVGLLMTGNWLFIWQSNMVFPALVLGLGFYALALLWVMCIVQIIRIKRAEKVRLALTTTP